MAIDIVDFPIKNGGSFHSFLYVYQRVDPRTWLQFQLLAVQPFAKDCWWNLPAEFSRKTSHCCWRAVPMVQWSNMVQYGPIWSNMVQYGPIWSNHQIQTILEFTVLWWINSNSIPPFSPKIHTIRNWGWGWEDGQVTQVIHTGPQKWRDSIRKNKVPEGCLSFEGTGLNSILARFQLVQLALQGALQPISFVLLAWKTVASTRWA